MFLTRYNNAVDAPVRRLFDNIVSDPFFAGWIQSGEGDAADNLAIDVSERGDETIVRASLPGFNKDEVDIRFQEGVLTIAARHSETSEEKGENFLRRERSMQTLTRSIRLPKVDHNGEAQAELENGVLTVHLPHAAESRPKQITIK